jgi:hypothetical protein
MNGYIASIEDLTEDNQDFRQVLYTGQHLQLVLMALTPGQDIGSEVHSTHDQFFRIEKGRGEIVIDGTTTAIKSEEHQRKALATVHALRPAQPRRSTGAGQEIRRRSVTRGFRRRADRTARHAKRNDLTPQRKPL